MTFRKLVNGDLEYEPMPGADFMAIRKSFDMSRKQFAALLGYTGEERNVYMTIKRYEEGIREVPPMVERLALLLKWYRADHGYLPDLDNGQPGPCAPAMVPDDQPVRAD
jgi:transcriptional regulator with XRE-family HTH domain